MRDGVALRADLWLPRGEGPHPTLVYRTPYGKAHVARDPILPKALARGYALLVQDVRGRHASGGEFLPYQQEGRDGYDTIEWAALQPWSSGRVGTFGLSYPGAVQWLAAVESPPHLLAMVPAMTFATPSHFWYAGGVWDGSWLAWTWLNIAPDLRRRLGAPGPASAEAAAAAWRREAAERQAQLPLREMPAFRGVADWYYEWMRHPPGDAWWDWAELHGRYSQVGAAVLNLSGWHDEMYGPSGAAMNFAGLVAARGGDPATARTQLLIGPWTHGTDLSNTRIGAREMGAAAAVDYEELVLRWMDRWVRGIDNGVDREAPVRLYAMGAGAWRSATRWPPPAEQQALYLSGTPVAGQRAGILQWQAPGSASASTLVSDAAH
ncbi:MAG: CocE/NonD family hydrolase, partial [Gammaproteobacteria bacterium]